MITTSWPPRSGRREFSVDRGSFSYEEEDCDRQPSEEERMSEQRASERITEEVTSWPGVVAGPGNRGEFAFKVGSREIGHLHGDHVAHFGFPKAVWKRLFEQGRIGYHPVFPGRPGFGARRIETEDDVDDVIALMRMNYDRVVERHGVPALTGYSSV
jgi:hypothetical protein